MQRCSAYKQRVFSDNRSILARDWYRDRTKKEADTESRDKRARKQKEAKKIKYCRCLFQMPRASAALMSYWSNFIEEPVKCEQLENTDNWEVTCGMELLRK